MSNRKVVLVLSSENSSLLTKRKENLKENKVQSTDKYSLVISFHNLIFAYIPHTLQFHANNEIQGYKQIQMFSSVVV